MKAVKLAQIMIAKAMMDYTVNSGTIVPPTADNLKEYFSDACIDDEILGRNLEHALDVEDLDKYLTKDYINGYLAGIRELKIKDLADMVGGDEAYVAHQTKLVDAILKSRKLP